MESKRHKRRLAKNTSDSDLFNLRKQICLGRKEFNSTIEWSSTCTANLSKQVIEEQVIDINYKESDNISNCERANDNVYESDFLLNFNENEILSFCEERDVLVDEYTYRYSDSEESSDDNDSSINSSHSTPYEDQHTFKESIRLWALSFKINQNAIKALLSILNDNTNFNFPNDPRTFLNTPRSVQISKIKNGEYYHIGLKKAVKNIINKLVEENLLSDTNSEVNLLISTDGAPLGKSSGLSMWPILCSATIFSFVQVIGIYVGENKPEDSNEFFKFFADEAKDFSCNGIIVDENKYKINIEGIICDIPAKSFVLKTKYFSGYNSCTKCEIYGTNIDNVVCFPNEDPTPLLRTDEKFNNFEYSEEFNDDYQKEECILKHIPNLGLVSKVPLDYMHLICLGVMRKLLLLWIKGPLACRLSSRQINIISEALLRLAKSIPSDFARKPRSLKYIKLWKATEFTSFLLYIGPVVLKGVLNSDAYIHFLMLHIAIRILADKESVKNPVNLDCARDLLKKFVQTFEKIYGASELLIPEQNFYEVPYPSTLLNISVVKRSKRLRSWPCDEIHAKMFQFLSNDKLIVFPILHTNNQERMYSIVEFPDGVLAVPTSWISKDNKTCKYPSNEKKALDAIKNAHEVEDDWPSWKLNRIFTTADSYTSAKEKEELLLMVSDCDDESKLRKSRSFRKRKAISSEDESEKNTKKCKKGKSRKNLSVHEESESEEDDRNITKYNKKRSTENMLDSEESEVDTYERNKSLNIGKSSFSILPENSLQQDTLNKNRFEEKKNLNKSSAANNEDIEIEPSTSADKTKDQERRTMHTFQVKIAAPLARMKNWIMQ